MLCDSLIVYNEARGAKTLQALPLIGECMCGTFKGYQFATFPPQLSYLAAVAAGIARET